MLGVILQYKLKAPPVYFISVVLGVGGIIKVIDEFDNAMIDGNIALLLSIVMIIVILYSLVNLNTYLIKNKGGR